MNIVKKSAVPFLYVYISPICDTLSEYRVSHPERDAEISAVTHERVKREKYSAWLLLERAIKESLGISIEEASLTKGKSGKWTSPLFYLSITHSGSLAAVAISSAPVGIDLEPLGKERLVTFAKKNLNKRELSDYLSLPDSKKNEFLLTRWCSKEAIFKKSGGSLFIPSSVDSYAEVTSSSVFSYGFEKYVMVISSDAAITPKITDFSKNN